MSHLRLALIIVMCLWGSAPFAQPVGEETEPTPEELDAAFTAEDAAREASRLSTDIAPEPARSTLESMAADADLVFRGTVASQTYYYDADGTPFTQTTFSIAEVLRGDYPGTEVNIIQEGGPALNDKHSAVLVSGSQHFGIGEEELLFIGLDPGSTVVTRRVNIRQRFPIHEGRVYNVDGYGVLVIAPVVGKGHSLSLSADRNRAPRFSQIHIGHHTLTRVFSSDHGRDHEGLPEHDRPYLQHSMPSNVESVDIATFSALVRGINAGADHE